MADYKPLRFSNKLGPTIKPCIPIYTIERSKMSPARPRPTRRNGTKLSKPSKPSKPKSKGMKTRNQIPKNIGLSVVDINI